MSSMDRMHAEMNETTMTGDVDADFLTMMVPHHRSAVEMAQVYLRDGRDPELRKLAEKIVSSQHEEIRYMQSKLPEAGATRRSSH